jgi:hypothetical protein
MNFEMKTKILMLLVISNLINAQTTNPLPYCNASFDDGFMPVNDAIKSISFGTLSNITNTQTPLPHYIFYNNLPIPLFSAGSTYTFSAIFEVHGGCGYGVWIDYNHNSIFESAEKIAGTSQNTMLDISDNTQVSQTITIPTSALSGITRMRVRLVEDDTFTMGSNGFSVLPCNSSTSDTDIMDWGETEDYLINMSSLSNDSFDLEKVHLYPNPTMSIFSFDNSSFNFDTIEIYNIEGIKLKVFKLFAFSSEQSLDVSELPTGTLILKFVNSKQTFLKKIIKI